MKYEIFKILLLCMFFLQNISGSTTSEKKGWTSRETHKYLEDRYGKQDGYDPDKALENITKRRSFHPFEAAFINPDADVLILGARPDQESVASFRHNLIEDPRVLFLDIGTDNLIPEGVYVNALTNPINRGKLVLANFENLSELKEFCTAKFSKIIFDVSTLKFFPFKGFKDLFYSLKQGGILYISVEGFGMRYMPNNLKNFDSEEDAVNFLMERPYNSTMNTEMVKVNGSMLNRQVYKKICLDVLLRELSSNGFACEVINACDINDPYYKDVYLKHPHIHSNCDFRVIVATKP